MKYILSNKLFWVLFSIFIAIILWLPLKNLRDPFSAIELQHLSNLLHNDLDLREYTQRISSCDEAPTTASSGAYDLICEQRAVSATKSQLERRRVYIKIFATHGLLLALLSFVILGAMLIYWFNRDSQWSFKLLCFTVIFLLFGAVGALFPVQHKYHFYEISAPLKQQEGGHVVASIRFKALDQNFKDYLVLAEKGKIKCTILSHLAYDQMYLPIKMSTQNNETINGVNQSDVVLSQQWIKDFINNPEMKIEFELENGKDLVYRDLPEQIQTRIDTLTINGKRVNIPSNNLLVYFKFENLQGEPLAIFY